MLSKRTFPLPIGGGLNEKDNPLQFDGPAVSTLTNARMPKDGMYAKSFGYDALVPGVPVSESTYGPNSTIAEHDGRAVVLTQLGAYMHDDARHAWVSSGAVSPRPSQVKTDALVRQNNSAVEPEIALVTITTGSPAAEHTIACVVWSDPELLCSFYMFCEVPADGSDLRIVSGPTKFAGSGTTTFGGSIRLATIGTTIYAIGASAGTGGGVVRRVLTSSCVVSSNYTFSNPATPAWGNPGVPVALVTDGTSLYAVIDENPGGTQYGAIKLTTAFANTNLALAVGRRALDACLPDGGATLVVLCSNGSIDSLSTTVPGAPTNNVITTPGATGPLFNASAVRGTITRDRTGGYAAAWERQGNAEPILNTGVVVALVTSVFGVTSVAAVGTVGLACRRDSHWDADVYDLEPVEFVGLIDNVNTAAWRCAYLARPAIDGASVLSCAELCRFGHDVAERRANTRFYQLTGGALLTWTSGVLPTAVYDAASKQWLLPFEVLADAASNGSLFEPRGKFGINVLRMNTGATQETATPQRNVVGQDLRIFAGGCGATYVDGPVHAEMTPPPVGIVATIAGDNEAASQYLPNPTADPTSVALKLAVRWRDEKGNLHRGVPVIESALISARGDDPTGNALRVLLPRPFPATIRGEKGGQTYEVEVYAALSVGGAYKYTRSVVTPRAHPTLPGIDYLILNVRDGTQALQVFPAAADYVAEIVIVGGVITGDTPWTETGELAHIPPPAARDVVSTQQRTWLLSAETGRLDLWPSKAFVRGLAPEFPSALRIALPDEGGEAVALAALDDKIVVFKERSLYVVFGDPPDNTGGGGTIQAPRLISSDVGCINPLSVCEGPFGVIFQGKSGFHVLDRGTAITDVGREVQDTLALFTGQCTAAVLVPDAKEVRFSFPTFDGTSLAWDYSGGLPGRWSRRSVGHNSSALRGGQHIGLGESSVAYVERRVYSTTQDSHAMTLRSAWVKLNGIAGFQRMWRTVFTFKYVTGRIKITCEYDYDTTRSESRTWTNTELLALDTDLGIVNLVFQHGFQKCSAMRWKIEEIVTVGQDNFYGEGFQLLGVEHECGLKKGSAALRITPDARK